MLSTSKFYTFLLIFLAIGVYVLSITFSKPLIDIELSREDDEWIIKRFVYDDWAKKKKLEVGDTLLKIDGVDVEQIEQLQFDAGIRGADEITVRNAEQQIIIAAVTYSDIPRQWYMQIVIPIIHFIVTLFVSIYLFHKKRMIPFVDVLIYFMLSMALAYISSGASARLNIMGVFINSFFLLLTVVLLIRFFKNYFDYLKIKGLFFRNLSILYGVPFLAILIRIYDVFGKKSSIVVLILFMLLVLYAFIILLHSYVRYRLAKLRWLVWSLLIPFVPFLIYIISEVLFGQAFIEADLCAAFIMFIPFSIIFFQLTDRLFDITYYFSRFRYYFILSLIVTSIVGISVYYLVGLSVDHSVNVSIILFFVVLIFLYVKEKIDYRGRKVLFASKGDHIHKLYQVTKNLGTAYKVKQVHQILRTEIAEHLEVKNIIVVSHIYETGEIESTDPSISLQHLASFEALKIGEIKRNYRFYAASIYKSSHIQSWLLIEHDNRLRLREEELIWLELLLNYTNTFIESTRIIEELIDELRQLQDNPHYEPQWLQKLIWLRIDREKFQVGQDLHDMFLQDLLHIARQMDLLKLEGEQYSVQEKLEGLHKQMRDSIYQLRAYCEKLKPPLLSSLGLNVALERLAEKTADRSSFYLFTTFDRLDLQDEQLILSLYRIVQELLNNALKHSKATNVELSVFELENGFEIFYEDDGVGCDLEKVKNSESLGLQGIRERVAAFNGTIQLMSRFDEGMEIEIKMYEAEES